MAPNTQRGTQARTTGSTDIVLRSVSVIRLTTHKVHVHVHCACALAFVPFCLCVGLLFDQAEMLMSLIN